MVHTLDVKGDITRKLNFVQGRTYAQLYEDTRDEAHLVGPFTILFQGRKLPRDQTELKNFTKFEVRSSRSFHTLSECLHELQRLFSESNARAKRSSVALQLSPFTVVLQVCTT